MGETDVLQDIRERIVRIETKLDAMADVKETANEAKETAMEALQSARSAHHRIDDVEANQTWLWRTIAGALITGAIAALFYFARM